MLLNRLTISIRSLNLSKLIKSSLSKLIPKSRNRVLDSIPTFKLKNRVESIPIF